MNKGPLFNNIKRDFSTRNSMGYDEVINSLQEKVSPIITNVTENIFYIAFMLHLYYAILQNKYLYSVLF